MILFIINYIFKLYKITYKRIKNLFIILKSNNQINIVNYNKSKYEYNDYFGTETLYKEYKEFTLNKYNINIELNIAEEYCFSNKFTFNNHIINNINKYFNEYMPKYITGFINTKINGELYIGIDDYGFIKGIPYKGTLPYQYIKKLLYSSFTKNITNIINFNKIIKINFIKINYNNIINNEYKTINPLFQKYIDDKNKYEKKYNIFLNKYNDWKKLYLFYNQKIIDLVNNANSRHMLIEYIKNKDFNNPCINQLESYDYKNNKYNYIMKECIHDEIQLIKKNQDKTSIYYWVTQWKDEMREQIKITKPKFNENFNNKNLPVQLITNINNMIPYWLNNNSNMNLYVIIIRINKVNIINNLMYYDLYRNKWIKNKRCIVNNEPVMINI